MAGLSNLVVGCYAWLHTKPSSLFKLLIATKFCCLLLQAVHLACCLVQSVYCQIFNVMYSIHVRRLWLDKTLCVICALHLWWGTDVKDHRNSTRNMIHLYLDHREVYYGRTQRLRWSRGSVLPWSTQVCGFKPGRRRQDFSGGKNPQRTFLWRGSKAIGPCRRFAACKRSLNETWKLPFRQNYRPSFLPTVPPFAATGLSCCTDVGAPGNKSGNV
jgi:hypothetical protein